MFQNSKLGQTPVVAAPVMGAREPDNYDREIQEERYDTLGWQDRARVLGDYLAEFVVTPLTLGIQGDWGSGKSSFINLFEQQLGVREDGLVGVHLTEGSLAGKLACYRHHGLRGENRVYVLRFNSWVFAQSSYTVDYLLPVYAVQVISDYLTARNAANAGLGDKIKRKIKQMTQVAGQKARGVAEVLLPAVLPVSSDAVDAALRAITPEQQADSLASFKDEFQELVAALLQLDAPAANAAQNRLIIIVDDLDRIAPVAAVEITEKIKVFLDVAGVIFILAADLSIIQNGLKQKFGNAVSAADGKNYLDKIVKIQYNVPQLRGQDLAAIMLGYGTFRAAVGLRPDTPLTAVQAGREYKLFRIFAAIGSNIRNVKRILLNFEFSHFLLTQGRHAINSDEAYRLLALTILYQYDYSLARAFYNWLADPAHEHLQLAEAEAAEADLLAQMAAGREHDAAAVAAYFGELVRAGYSGRDWLAAYVATTMSEVAEQAAGLASRCIAMEKALVSQ